MIVQTQIGNSAGRTWKRGIWEDRRDGETHGIAIETGCFICLGYAEYITNVTNQSLSLETKVHVVFELLECFCCELTTYEDEK